MPFEKEHEYEKIGRKFKIDGHFYYFRFESMTKNKQYSCIERNTKRCRGSITISPNSRIVKKIEHICNKSQNDNYNKGRAKAKLISEELHEYEDKDGRFKINGNCYYYRSESSLKNKYFTCVKRDRLKICRGSITMSPDRKIVKKVEHTCNKSKISKITNL